jgi:hypothetical protein
MTAKCEDAPTGPHSCRAISAIYSLATTVQQLASGFDCAAIDVSDAPKRLLTLYHHTLFMHKSSIESGASVYIELLNQGILTSILRLHVPG